MIPQIWCKDLLCGKKGKYAKSQLIVVHTQNSVQRTLKNENSKKIELMYIFNCVDSRPRGPRFDPLNVHVSAVVD